MRIAFILDFDGVMRGKEDIRVIQMDPIYKDKKVKFKLIDWVL